MKVKIVLTLALLGIIIFSKAEKAPNILFVISDDQSFPHASVYGSKTVNTPNFDRVAREGILFTNAIVPSPGCSPSRASMLTGRYTWQIEEAGTHASSFPSKYKVYPDILEEEAGYLAGYSGKGWGPGDWEKSGRKRNPAGTDFNTKEINPPFDGISGKDYVANFIDFYKQKSADQPFCFWLGTHEPHRVFEQDSWKKAGKSLEDAEVPDFLPDNDLIRGDILDYAVEIEWVDKQLGKVLKFLEEKGELDNTLIVVTSDNGMAFPRAKANCFEFGVHVPLAIRWGNKVQGGQVVDDVVSLVDVAPTFLDAAGVSYPKEYPYAGKSLMSFLLSENGGKGDTERPFAFSARERHSCSRYNNWTYPQRAVRTKEYLYVYNFEPDRWPAGDPLVYVNDDNCELQDAFTDIDNCPSKSFLLENRHEPETEKYFHLAIDKRLAEELYDIVNDPYCLNNLAEHPEFSQTRKALNHQLFSYLKQTGDPRATGENPYVFESYPRLKGPMRAFPVQE